MFTAVYAASIVVWLLFIRNASPLTWRAVVLLAVAIRVPLLLEPPRLSGDVYRYLWDGQVSASGRNPYDAPPDALDLIQLRQPWHASINHPEIPTIYPPLAQALFFFNALIGGTLLGWRLLILLTDLLTLTLLRSVLDTRPLAAWVLCPLVVIEGVWSGHLEVVVTTTLVAAFVLLMSKKELSAGAWLGVAAGLKITPIFALPGFLAGMRNRTRLATACGIAFATPLAIAYARGPLMPGFREYATRWVFNSPAYEVTRAVFDWVGLEGHARQLWTSIKDPLGLESISGWVYAQLYVDPLVRATLAVVLVITLIAITRSSQPPAEKIAWSLSALLLCSPAVHPWYWLPVVPFALVSPWGSRVSRDLATRPAAPAFGPDTRLGPASNSAAGRGTVSGGTPDPLYTNFLLWLALCAPASYLLYDRVAEGIVWSFCYGLPLLIALVARFRSSRVERNMQSP